jgi:hypothetical protein
MVAVIEHAREEFGDRWAIYRLAATNAGMFNLPTRRPDVARIEDAQTPLFERAYLARAYRGRPSWWTDRIGVDDPDLRLFWLTILLGWAPASHVQANLPIIERLVGELDGRSIERLQEAVAIAAHYRNFRGGKARASVDGANVRSASVAFLLWTAFGQEQLASLPPEVRVGEDLARALSAEATRQKWSTFPGWSKVKSRDVDGWLEVLRSLRVIQHGRLHLGDIGSMPAAVAAKILSGADAYPGETLRVAYAATMSRYKPEPVADIATKAGWALG